LPAIRTLPAPSSKEDPLLGFADPVVEALVRQIPARDAHTHEEAIGLQVVGQVEAMEHGVLSALDVAARVLAG